jgi:hypothetical protein
MSKGERNKVMDILSMHHCKRQKVFPSMKKGEIVEKMLSFMLK